MTPSRGPSNTSPPESRSGWGLFAGSRGLFILVVGCLILGIGIGVGGRGRPELLAVSVLFLFAALGAPVVVVFSRQIQATAVVLWLAMMVLVPTSLTSQRVGGVFGLQAMPVSALLELVVVGLAGIFLLGTSFRDRWRWLGEFKSPIVGWFAVFGGLALLSTAYSSHRTETLRQSGELLVAVALPVVLVMYRRSQRWSPMRLARIGMGAISLSAIALRLVRPSYVWRPDIMGVFRLGGALMHPNQLGFAAAIFVLASLPLLLGPNSSGRRIFGGLCVVVGGIVVVLTRGRADLAGLVLGLGIVVVLIRRRSMIVLALAGCGLAAVSLAVKPTALSGFLELVTRNQGILTQGGRLGLWGHILTKATTTWQGIFLGIGFGNSRFELAGVVPGWANPSHAHNALLEALLVLGIPGAVLILLAGFSLVVETFRTADRLRRSDPVGSGVLLGMVGLILIVSLVEASFAGRLSIYTFGYLTVAGQVLWHKGTRYQGNLSTSGGGLEPAALSSASIENRGDD